MYYIYIIKSLKDGKLYIGYTTRLSVRLKQHNNGENISTKPRRLFKIIYYEAYSSEKDARKREINLQLFSKAYYSLKRRMLNSLNN